MNADIPSQAVLAVAAIVASLITGMIAMVNLTLGKEQKVSEFRQAWIDALRDDLSKFFSSLRFLVEATQVRSSTSREFASEIFPHSLEQLAELRVMATETLTRIALRLNPDEPEHVELLRLLRSVHAICFSAHGGTFASTEALYELDVAAEYARPVLKSEWDRVKRGEPTFRRLRIWIVPMLVMLMIGFAAFISFGTFQK